MLTNDNNNRCEAIKSSDGLRCTFSSKYTVAGGKRVCGNHRNTKTIINTPEPWTVLGLIAPSTYNGKRIIQSIRTKLLDGPKKGDGAGTIYMYQIQQESALFYFKIGKTARGDADKRLDEWARKHQKNLLVHEKYPVTQNLTFIEVLIHTYLRYCNIHRTPHKDSFHSVFSLHNKVVCDGHQWQEGDERLVAKDKHVEWFFELPDKLKRVISAIVDRFGK